MKAEFRARSAGMNPKLVDQEDGDQKYAGRKEERDEVRDLIPVTTKASQFYRAIAAVR